MALRELARRAKHKLAVLHHVEQVSGNVSATYRYYGISRQCYYTWRRRFDEEGLEGLKDRSSVPHHQPTKSAPEIIEQILWPTAARHYFGPPRISMYLHRCHDIEINPSRSGPERPARTGKSSAPSVSTPTSSIASSR
ncbi:helix-turn-helix domain-containing protein [Rhodococcus rhodochrous]|uniref:Helix-turn-helix domain-containing protein n=1 Tax=Rhodococcus rhodochrous TaxID=1829 RepID=A0AAW4XNI4_RHORH|nr:leucine zipper domain-containing protein [Rhodococcus rhodochrous]MCD2114628.1 helix-turn-helix domain-containing protein [Rhodococcus rhodochrous]